ncbi:MAG: spore coat protein [Clostridiales bacterium]|nr:spore coat protein [Clostridiales bacterium]
MVNLTPKEMTWINDLKSQEKLCIEKYRQYAQRACDNRLKTLFQELEQNEQSHLNWLEEMGRGQVPAQVSGTQGNQNKQAQQNRQESCTDCGGENMCSQQDWQQDQFLCQDALSMEKHVSSAYDTGIFEFADPQFRQALNMIQKQEQEHGEKIYQYMAQNNMYH